MFTDTLALLGLGFLLGLEHTLDADHLVAVSSLITRKTSIFKASLTGMVWGLGHTVILLVAGIIILALKIIIPKSIEMSLEFIVGIMIVVLGVNVLFQLFRKRHKEDSGHSHMAGGHLHSHDHHHGNTHHVHTHSHDDARDHSSDKHEHYHQPFIVGIIHGLAGSASLMLLILASIESLWVGIAYIAIFGLGTLIGMAILGALMSLPFVLTSRNFEAWNRRIRFAAGTFSIIFGLYIMYKIAFLEGLLL